MKYLIIVFTFVVFFSCKKDENTECTKINYNQAFTASVGTTYCIDENNSIVIDSVANQLCPCNVVCVWEGEYSLRLSVTADGKNYQYNLGTSLMTPDVQPFNDFTIEFLSISPFKCEADIQSNYRVEMKLKRS